MTRALDGERGCFRTIKLRAGFGTFKELTKGWRAVNRRDSGWDAEAAEKAGLYPLRASGRPCVDFVHHWLVLNVMSGIRFACKRMALWKLLEKGGFAFSH